MLEQFGVELDAMGNVKADADKRTSVAKVFTAGDMTRGQSLIVWAIAEGRHAAYAIDEYPDGHVRPAPAARPRQPRAAVRVSRADGAARIVVSRSNEVTDAAASILRSARPITILTMAGWVAAAAGSRPGIGPDGRTTR